MRIESSAVRAVRYNAASGKLDVRFEDGREYRYSEVPRSMFRALLAAKSIGGFVNREIKPNHPCKGLVPARRSTSNQMERR
jgi:hypothetical protein